MKYTTAKRAIDVAASAIGLLTTSPVLVAAGVAIRITDGPPVIFRQDRAGRSGRTFTIYKFRSMTRTTASMTSADAANMGLHTTPIGSILRRASVDELPQLFNILKGDMSLVGPRPAMLSQSDLLSVRSAGAHELRPGLTGLAQVRSFDAMSPEKKANFDNEYAATLSWRHDLTILLATIAYLFRPPPAY